MQCQGKMLEMQNVSFWVKCSKETGCKTYHEICLGWNVVEKRWRWIARWARPDKMGDTNLIIVRKIFWEKKIVVKCNEKHVVQHITNLEAKHWRWIARWPRPDVMGDAVLFSHSIYISFEGLCLHKCLYMNSYSW